jgi:hypothetical protein
MVFIYLFLLPSFPDRDLHRGRPDLFILKMVFIHKQCYAINCYKNTAFEVKSALILTMILGKIFHVRGIEKVKYYKICSRLEA